MITAFRKSFERDLRKLAKSHNLLDRVRDAIEEVERADDFRTISGVKKLSGGGNYYRIRIGDYRIGIVLEKETVTFVRCLHRRDIYRYFP